MFIMEFAEYKYKLFSKKLSSGICYEYFIAQIKWLEANKFYRLDTLTRYSYKSSLLNNRLKILYKLKE